MRVPSTRTFIQATEEYSQRTFSVLIRQVGDLWSSFQRALNGNLTFGDGTDYDNIKGKWATFVSSATPDLEFSYTHDLGAVPVGYLIMSSDKAGVLYRGSTTWTTSLVYFKCNVASTTFTIFLLLAPSEE
jgi:hypothetical protein